MNNYHNYRKLHVWEKSIELVTEIYSFTNLLPKEERFGLVSQIHRAAVSIPTNIAEGCGRNSNPQMIQFLNIARGSITELETLLLIVDNVYHINLEKTDQFINQLNILQKQIYKLMDSLAKKTL